MLQPEFLGNTLAFAKIDRPLRKPQAESLLHYNHKLRFAKLAVWRISTTTKDYPKKRKTYYVKRTTYLLFGKNAAQQFSGAGNRVLADIGFFLGHQQEQPVDSLLGSIAGQVRVYLLYQGNAVISAHHV
jgi:hypothetical protein